MRDATALHVLLSYFSAPSFLLKRTVFLFFSFGGCPTPSPVKNVLTAVLMVGIFSIDREDANK